MSPINVPLFFRREKGNRNSDRKQEGKKEKEGGQRAKKQSRKAGKRRKARTCGMVKGSKRRRKIKKNSGGGKKGPREKVGEIQMQGKGQSRKGRDDSKAGVAVTDKPLSRLL